MDANGTRFQLMQGAADWPRWRTRGGVPAQGSTGEVEFAAQSQEVTLWSREFRFPASPGDRPVSVDDDRRGAARDGFGNWYWIAPSRDAILVRSSGSGETSVFWPVEPEEAAPAPGSFGPREPPVSRTWVLQGLAVTVDHHLVAGTSMPGGLVVFDLASGGAPRERVWPLAFTPWDIVPRPEGGAIVLDRAHRCLWALDRRFDVDTACGPGATREPGDFVRQHASDVDLPQPLAPRMPVEAHQAWPLAGLADPIAVEVMDDGSVLVLDRQGADGFASVQRMRNGLPLGAPASTAALALHIAREPGAPALSFAGHDFALSAREDGDNEAWRARLFIVDRDGNQAYGFGVVTTGEALALVPIASFQPMRLFGGRALVQAGGAVWYDCDDRFVRLTAQCRPRHVEEGELWTPLLDGGEPGCVWHRLRLDAVLPPATAIEVWSRAADDWRELMPAEALSALERQALGLPATGADPGALAGTAVREWEREPDPLRRGDGPELPFVPAATGRDAGTFELLFQRAVGRFAQVRLVLRGDGRATPRLRALRAWYPRFSYLQRYLPAVYRDDAASASFLERFLANVEGQFTTLEDRIAAAQQLFDVDSAPTEALDWLGRWFGLALDPSWDDARRRLLIRHAMDFFAVRGTVRGLQLALRLALDDCVDERLFADPALRAGSVAPVRIVERFRTRRTPGLLVGDVGTGVKTLPQVIDPAQRWQPGMGGAELHRRYRAALGLPADRSFPLVADGAPEGWAAFAERELRFVPGSATAERAAWQAFQRKRSGTVAIPEVPADAPVQPAQAETWSAFLAATPSADRRRWQAFLARRYRSIATLSEQWRTRWAAFADVALPDRLPPDGPALADWFTYEGTVRRMHEHAHHFTVMLPVPARLRHDALGQQSRLERARRVLELEKPAHTVYDLRFYWAMFRVGEARLGDDTLVDLGSRAPELMAPMVLGTGALAETYLAAPAGRDAPGRLQLGRDRVGRSTRVGGP